MGQKSSSLLRPKISLTWVLRGQQQSTNTTNNQENLSSLEIKERPFRNSVKSMRSIKSTKTIKEKSKDNNATLDNREIKLHRIENDTIEKVKY